MTDPSARLTEILGPEGVVPEGRAGSWSLSDGPPAAVALPATEREVADALRVAVESGWRVVPTGAGTSLRGRRPDRRPTVVICTARMHELHAYEPADLTLAVGAGATMGALEERLAREGQWIPLDPPGTSARSVGGVLAAGTCGPLWTAFGAPRDHVLGLTVVTGDARVLRLGGRVVKNVAGFDLVRLMVGSRGALGVVTSANLRVFPRPQVDRALVCTGESAEALLGAARAVATASVLPAAVEVVEPAPFGRAPAALVVRVMGAPEEVEADADTLRRETGVDLSPLEEAAAGVFRDVANHGSEGSVTARVTGLPGDSAESLAIAREWLRWARDVLTAHAAAPPAGEGGESPSWEARVRVSPALGTVHAALLSGAEEADTPARTAAPVPDELARLRREARSRGGDLTLLSAPASVWTAAGPWAERSANVAALTRSIVREFDPSGVLSHDGAGEEGGGA